MIQYFDLNSTEDAFIVQTSFCVAFSLMGIILLIAAIKVINSRSRFDNYGVLIFDKLLHFSFSKFQKNSLLCLTWMLSLAFVTVGRVVAAILFDVNFMRYGLFYWLIRPFQIWCVWVYRNSARRMEVRHGKIKKRKSKTPDFVPVTYYGVMAKVEGIPDQDVDDRTVRAGDGTSDKSYNVKYVLKPKQ